jgi:hypothetical protein
MKVLLMTLQNDPPTLDRTASKRKFSRSFKDMIDLCLQKDPTKRLVGLAPVRCNNEYLAMGTKFSLSAEKLLQHPFFKHAKKRGFLVDTIVKNLPPLADRPHRGRRKYVHLKMPAVSLISRVY